MSIKETNDKIAQGVTTGFQKIEDGVVGGYKKIEEGVVGGFTKIEDKFVGKFLTHEGETVEDAKKRIAEEQAQRDAQAETQIHVPASDIGKASVEASREMARASVETSRNAGKH